MPKVIEFDYTNADASSVGSDNGLELTKTFTLFKTKMSEWVLDIWANKSVAGSWLAWLKFGSDQILVPEILKYAESVKGQFDNVVVLGIGGSALGSIAVTEALLKPYWNLLSKEQRNGYPRIFFMDNIDPDYMKGLLDIIDVKETLFNVISKSGNTTETMAQYIYISKLLKEQCGENYKYNIVVTTDKTKGALRQIANQEGLTSFVVPDDIGGRFSVFTAVGLLPFALVGLDIEAMQQGISEITPILQDRSIFNNPAGQNALINVISEQKKGKKMSVCMPYSSRLRYVSDWYCQLWAESLGKDKDLKGLPNITGQTPIKALGVTDQHSQIQLYNEGPKDKVITFIRVGKFDNELVIPNSYANISDLEYLSNKTINSLINAELEATKITVTGCNVPNTTITLPEINEFYLAQLLFMFEVQTAIAGKMYNINAFNQPGVELGKNYTYALMGRKGYEKVAGALKIRMDKPPLRIKY